MNKFSNWRRHRVFNIGRGISAAISFTGILIVAAACGTSDLDLSSLEQLILTFCMGVAVMLLGFGLYLIVEYAERKLKGMERRRRYVKKEKKGQKGNAENIITYQGFCNQI